MSGLPKGQALACVALVILVLTPTSLVLFEKTLPTPESLFNEGMAEFERSNYGAASDLFNRSFQGYREAGATDQAMLSHDWKCRADRVRQTYCLDRHQAEELLAETFPWVPGEERNAWLDLPATEKIVSDGKEWFFESIANNIAFRNMTLYHEWMDDPNSTWLVDTMQEILAHDANRSGTYFNPASYTAYGVLTLPRMELPAFGTLQVWVPAPIETASQTNVEVTNVSPLEYVVTMPDTSSPMGQVYLEIPLEGWTSDVVVTVGYSFTEYQKHFDVDPEQVGRYERNSWEYVTYTSSTANVVVTPEICTEARTVVGDETNPYLQAKLIYDYVVGNITYSYMPHGALTALGVPESEYVRTHRYGDCGAQSMYFSALLRSLGIPARAAGGYQTLHGGTSSHFWAEFFLPNYGWVPVDVTAADGMDWISSEQVTPEQRAAFKAYFFGNLDHCRYVSQNSTDIPNDPKPLMLPSISGVFQGPTASCVGAFSDVPVLANLGWKLRISMVP